MRATEIERYKGGQFAGISCHHCANVSRWILAESGTSTMAVCLECLPSRFRCVTCGAGTSSTVAGELGDARGVLCADCAHWCDGNVSGPPAMAGTTTGGGALMSGGA